MKHPSRLGKTFRLMVCLGFASTWFALDASRAEAQTPYGRGGSPYSSGYYTSHRHEGLYMRLLVGVGHLSTSENRDGWTEQYSGLGGTFSAALGGSIAPNLVIFGELMGTSITNATRDISGSGATFVELYSGTDLVQYGLGPGISYYFEPVNLYVSGTLMFTRVSFSDTDTAYTVSDTDTGVGASFVVGKEWWIGPNIGLGVAGHAQFASMGDPAVNSRLRSTVLSLLLSLSYN